MAIAITRKLFKVHILIHWASQGSRMRRRFPMTRKFLLRGAAHGLAAAALALTPAAAGAQTLPSPRQFVDNLDLRCYQIPNQSPINQKLRLDHLNPVLVGL